MLDHVGTLFRQELGGGIPGQAALAERAHGQMDFLISHRASMRDGRIVLEAVPGAYNDTPFWIIQTSSDLCQDHGDIRNDRFLALVRELAELNRLYEPGIRTWMRASEDAPR